MSVPSPTPGRPSVNGAGTAGLGAASLGLLFTLLLACGGSTTQSNQQLPAAPQITTFTAAQNPVTAGAGTQLTAAFTGGTGLIDHGVGTVSSSVPIGTGAVAADTTFTLTVSGPGGTVTGSVAVDVAPVPMVPVLTCSATTLMAGQAGYTASVPLQTGMVYTWVLAGGTLTGGNGTAQVTFTAGQAGTLQLSCLATNAAGTSSLAGTLSLPVLQGPTISAFKASPGTVTAGQSATLTWSVSGATTLSLDRGLGPVSGTSLEVAPTATTTYTLTATNATGSVTATATVTVQAAGQVPTISSFTATPATISAGQTSVLSWSAPGATGLSLAPGVGVVTGSQWTVAPTATTTYTLTATSAAGSATATVKVTVTAATGGALTFTLPGGVTLELVAIPAGTFTMGSVNAVDTAGQPPHTVTLSHGFSMGTFLVTQQQYQAVTGTNPAAFALGPTYPVESVAWTDLNQTGGFFTMLNALTASSIPAGLVFRLPTEAEWE